MTGLMKRENGNNSVVGLTFPGTSLWENTWNSFDQIFDGVLHGVGSLNSRILPDVSFEIIDQDDQTVIRAEVPGIDKKDLDISLKDSTLVISGEKQQAADSSQGSVKMSEMYYGKFSRSFTVQKALTEEDIEATLENGVLTITMPKKEKSEIKQIEIK